MAMHLCTAFAAESPSSTTMGGRLLLSFLSYANRSTDLALTTMMPPLSTSLSQDLAVNESSTVITTAATAIFGTVQAMTTSSSGGGGDGGIEVTIVGPGAAPLLLQPLFSQGIETMALIVLVTVVLALTKVVFVDLGHLLRAFVRQVAIFVLTSGPDNEDFVPKHVAFIMDGNRRWAQHQGLVKKSEGHKFGYDKLHESLHWCARLGIQTVTVYAFSIENFKRPQEEVDTLMNLARDKFLQMVADDDIVKKHQMRVRVIGNLDLLPPFVQHAAAQAIEKSRDNSRVVFNVCIPYTSTDEIVSAMNLVARGVHDGLLQPDDVSAQLIDQCLYCRHSPPPDLVIRTSGETRLSDFLLWQSGSYTVLSFLDVMWPDFSEWDFFKTLWHYQRSLKHLKRSRQRARAGKEDEGPTLSADRHERVQRFLQLVDDEDEHHLHEIYSASSCLG